MKRSLVAFFLAAGLLGHGVVLHSAFAQDGLAPAAADCPFHSSPNGAAIAATLPTTPDDEVKSFKELLELRAAWADEAAALPEAAPAPAAVIDDAPLVSDAPLADIAAPADVAPVMESAVDVQLSEFDFGETAEPPAPTDEPADAPAIPAVEEAIVAPAPVEPAMPSRLVSELPMSGLLAIDELVSEAPPEPIDEEPAVELAPLVEESLVADEAAPEAMEAIVEEVAIESPRQSAGRKLAARIGDFGRNTLIGFGEFLAVFHPGNWFVEDLNEDAALDIADDSQPIEGELAIDEMPLAPEAAIEADLAIEEAPLVEIEAAMEAEVAADVAPIGEPGVDFDEAIVSEGVVIASPEAAPAAAIDDLADKLPLDLSIEATIIGATSEAVGSHVVSRQDAPAVSEVQVEETILLAEPAAIEAAPAMEVEAPAVLEEAGPSLALDAAPADAEAAMEAEVAVEPAPAAELAAEAIPAIEGVINPFDAASARTLDEMFDDEAPPAPESIIEREVLEEVAPEVEAPEASMKLLEIQSYEFEELKSGIDG